MQSVLPCLSMHLFIQQTLIESRLSVGPGLSTWITAVSKTILASRSSPSKGESDKEWVSIDIAGVGKLFMERDR